MRQIWSFCTNWISSLHSFIIASITYGMNIYSSSQTLISQEKSQQPTSSLNPFLPHARNGPVTCDGYTCSMVPHVLFWTCYSNWTNLSESSRKHYYQAGRCWQASHPPLSPMLSSLCNLGIANKHLFLTDYVWKSNIISVKYIHIHIYIYSYVWSLLSLY